MKKLLSLILCLMMLVSGCALAEDTSVVEVFEGNWINFDDGLNVYLPADWLIAEEMPEEYVAAGIYFAAASPDETNLCTIAWKELPAETTIEAAQAELATVYTDAVIMETQFTQMVFYTDAERNMMNFVMLDPTQPGMYMFCFRPVTEELALTAGMIIGTVHHTPVEEAAE